MSARKMVSTLLVGSAVCVAASLFVQRTVERARAQAQGVSLTTGQIGQLRRLAGEFEYVSSDSREALHRSLVEATRNVPPTDARLSWAQLEMMLLPAKRVVFSAANVSATSGTLEMRAGSAMIRTELDGVLRPLSAQRTNVRLSQRVQGTSLQQIVENRGFRLERSFSLDGAGSTLTLDVRVTGQTLSTPVRLKANYRRL